jgi:hypothetical protein
VLGLATAAALGGQTPPDFSGVYYPINPFGRFVGGPAAGAGQRQGPPPKPTASAPLADGSQGRRPDEPSLTPEYMAKWQTISKTLIAGSSQYDLTARCLPPGMPAMMSMFYGMEVMQNKDKITFFSELNDALRRVYLDGRKPSQKHQMTVHERIRLKEPGLLEDRITVTDPKALTKPWETVKTYRKAKPGSGTDELREFACPEGLSEAK